MAEIIGFEGLDGAGKTTLAKHLARRGVGTYRYYIEGNPYASLKPFVNKIENPQFKFLYYMAVNLMNVPLLQNAIQNSDKDILLDRTPYSTYTAHYIQGVDTSLFDKYESLLISPISKFVYVRAAKSIREGRIKRRDYTNPSDLLSIEYSEELEAAYLSKLPDHTFIFSSNRSKAFEGNVNNLIKFIQET